MTEPISYRSVTRTGTYANCRGVNHHDGGEIVVHDRCGDEVVKSEKTGKLHNVERSGFYQARKFSCYHPTHECDPELAALRTAEREQAAADGEIVKGCTVEVFKGRKVPKGTTGKVFWLGDKGYGLTVGLRTETGDAHFTAVGNCRVV